MQDFFHQKQEQKIIRPDPLRVPWPIHALAREVDVGAEWPRSSAEAQAEARLSALR